MSWLRARYLSLFIAGAFACNKPAPTKSCEEFEAAMTQLDEVSQASLDPTLGDPRFGPVATALEAVGPECRQHSEAQATANTIRAAMAKYKAATPPAPVVVRPPPLSPEEEAEAIAKYLQAYDATDSGTTEADTLAAMKAKRSTQPAVDEFGRLKSQLERLSRPRACDELHRATIAVIDETIEMFRDLQSAVDTEDKGALKAVEARRLAIKQDREKLKALRLKACKP